MALDQDALDSLRMDRPTLEAAAHGRARPWVIGGVIVLLLVVAVVAWFATRPAAIEVGIAAVRMEQGAARAASGGSVLSASGYVVAERVTVASSKVTGMVREVLIEEGMEVKAGQVVARLDDSTARKQVDLARSQLNSARLAVAESEARYTEAERSVRRNRTMREQNLTSEATLDAAEAEFESAKARLATARSEVEVAARSAALAEQNLADYTIRAPFSGVVVSKNAQVGEMISPVSAGGGFTRTGICAIVDMASLEVEVDVNESYINRVVSGQPVEAVLDAYPEWRIPARVSRIVPTADRQKATVRVRIEFDALDPRILPDMGVQVSFFEAPSTASAVAPAADSAPPRRRLLVPASAVVQRDGSDVVFVVHDDVVERRAVSVGRASRDEVEVTGGLDEGESVVVAPPAELADGARIKVR
jgi:RND family efflux transporter MFP subunit